MNFFVKFGEYLVHERNAIWPRVETNQFMLEC